MADHDEGKPAGLSSEQARIRLAIDGPNELARAGQPRWLRYAVDILQEPMFLLLLACAAVYRMIGDPADASILFLFVFIVIVITLLQQWRTEIALVALRDLGSPRALVLRDGSARRIAGPDVVLGDLLILNEGDRVAADGRVMASTDLTVDESILTGESVAQLKTARTTAQASTPDGNDDSRVFAGSLTVRGRALVRVTAIGNHTRLGQIGKSLEAIAPEPTPLQREVRLLVRRFSWLGAALCVIVALAYGAIRLQWVNGILAGLTLAMALLPEEFPVILTIYFALGAWRMARLGILTRRMPALEALGATTVLCVDKTGTLTRNQMQVRCLAIDGQRLDLDGNAAELPESMHALVEFAILAGQSEPFEPMELAMKSLGDAALAGTEHLHAQWIATREYSLSPVLLAVTRAYRPHPARPYVAAAKGAPEAIIDLCHLSPPRAGQILAQVDAMAAEGLRVIAVAVADVDAPALPERQHDIEFRYLGLVGYEDPLRAGVRAAIAACRRAGVRLIMLTGDHPQTASAIARQAGIDAPDRVCSGPDLRGFEQARVRELVRSTQVFARVMPDQKLGLVEALLANGEIVAMTGDGVNDAPALRRAHVGIAMGQRGTDVAREAASLVLTDDAFESIVRAIHQGRRIFTNLRSASAYVLAIHVPIAVLTLLPVMTGWPLILLPFQIAILHMVIDPACSIVIESEPAGAGLMHQPPRKPRTPMLDRSTLAWGMWQGAVVAAACLLVYQGARSDGLAEALARSQTFAALLALNAMLIISNRSRERGFANLLLSQNRTGWAVLIGIALLLAALLSGWPTLPGHMAPSPISGRPLAVVAVIVAAAGVLIEFSKAVLKRVAAGR